MISFNEPNILSELLAQDTKNLLELIRKSEKTIDSDWIYVFLIIRFLQFQDCEEEQCWREFREEILYKNRYFPQSELLEKIKAIAPYATKSIETGKILYRCREYDDEALDNNSFIRNCMDFIISELPELSLEYSDFKNYSKTDTILSMLLTKPGISDKIKEKYQIIKDKHDSFWGFDAENNDAPKKSKTRSMRANPEGIAYLYTAEDIETALSEMRPQLGQTYSVANILVKDNVKLFDFSMAYEGENPDQILFSKTVLDKMFSDPNYGDPLEYVPTQCICEYIRQLGFDGIRYNSALRPEGKNIVLFDVTPEKKKYEVTGTEVYMIGNIKIDYSRILPIPEEVLNNKLYL